MRFVKGIIRQAFIRDLTDIPLCGTINRTAVHIPFAGRSEPVMTATSQWKPTFTRIHQVISPWAETRPGALALKDAQRSLTYAELARATTQAGARLQDLGL